MSALSPVRRLRTKTSDISDFFRTTQPQSTLDDNPSPKSKRTRIPFLGRSRKKSAQSDALSPNPDKQLPLSNPSPPTLASKLTAHFTSTKHRPPHLALDSNTPSSSLIPPSPSPRATSFDSASTASQDRSPTPRPRPLRPTITVSVSPPEDLDAFHDLFTKPRPPPLDNPKTPLHQNHLPIPPKFDPVDSSDDDKLALATPTPTPPASPRMQSQHSPRILSPSFHIDDGSASDFSSGDQSENRFNAKFFSSKLKPAKKKQIPVSVLKELERGLGTKLDFDSAEEFEDFAASDPNPSSTESATTTTTSNTPWKRQTVATMPYKSSERSTSPRSCLKTSSAFGKGMTAPPSIPLPSPPTAYPSFASLPSIPPTPSSLSSRKSTTTAVRSTSVRPRAHTIPSVIPSPDPTATVTTSPSPDRSSSLKSKDKTRPKSPHDKKLPDIIDSPTTTEQLQDALKLQRARFDDLAAYLLTVTEKHATEKAALMKKIDSLEREARKTGRELKGLRYLVMNATGSGVFTGGLPNVGSNIRTASDDGAESLDRTSTDARRRGQDTLSPNVESLTVPTIDGGGTDLLSLSNFDRRSSSSSYSSFMTSATSSTSSLPLTAASTVSSGLSAIPETRTPSPETGRDPAVAAAILAAERQREKEERRASRALRRFSSSSSSSSAASGGGASAAAAYATNLKRGRPPSIAQVLGESPSMEDVLEKLRPFATPASNLVKAYSSSFSTRTPIS